MDTATATARPPVEQPGRPVVTFGYTPGLDGLRALGLLTILAYHHGYRWAQGGIFTLSMFFTLSGFLIASLTLAEWSKRGRVSMRSFWERRARRLLPAAFVTLAAIVLLQKRYAIGSGPQFKGDVLAAFGYVANWRYAVNGSDYAAIFLTQQPVQHFWSLAVEEQFYLVFPLLFVGAMALSRGRWKVVGGVFAALSALSYVAAWITASQEHSNSGYAYFATHTRASEILVGVTLAFVMVAAPVRRFLTSPGGARAVRLGAVVGALGYVWLWHSVGLSSSFVFHGGTMLNAVFTSLLIVACCAARPGIVARALAVWPLRSIGKVSYALYLFHWPLFIYMSADRVGMSGWRLFALRVGAVLVLAVVSYFVVESPFRFWLKLSGLRLAAVLAVPAVLLVGLVQVVDVQRSAAIDLQEAAAADPFKPGVVRPPDDASPPPTRILLVGDSVSWTMWPGMITWNEQHPHQTVFMDTVTAMGCPIGKADTIIELGKERNPFDNCINLRRRLVDAVKMQDYDAILVAWGGADLGSRRIDEKWRHLGDQAFDSWFRNELSTVGDILAREEVPVFWSKMPPVHMRDFEDPTRDWRDFDDNDPARTARLNELFNEVLFTRPEFHPLDVGAWLATAPGGVFDTDMRGDGVHYNWDGSDKVAAWILPQIFQAVAAQASG